MSVPTITRPSVRGMIDHFEQKSQVNPVVSRVDILGKEKLPSFGCTSFKIPGSYAITARSMEFPLPIPWSVVAYQAGMVFASIAPNNQPGVTWTSKYGIVGFGVEGVNNLLVEGMNTQGLTMSAQSLDATVYPTVPEGISSVALPVSDFISWGLSNFKTCEELAAGLGSVVVWGNNIPGLGEQPLHFAVSDPLENGVIEFLNGKVKFYKNPIGALTNDPPFKWHQQTLVLYNGLNNIDPPNATINGVSLPTQYSTGSYGLPGGEDAVSRFGRIAWKIGKLNLPTSNTDAQQIAWHLLNTIDRVAGTTAKVYEGSTVYETTQWVVVRDHTNLTLDVRTYGNNVIHRLDVNATLKGLASGAQKSVELSELIPPAYVMDEISF